MPDADEIAGVAWWNSLTETGRRFWLARTSSCTIAEAWEAYNAPQYTLDYHRPTGGWIVRLFDHGTEVNRITLLPSPDGPVSEELYGEAIDAGRRWRAAQYRRSSVGADVPDTGGEAP
jgi:hypothetical protein